MAKKRLSAVTKVTTAGDNDYIVMNTSEGKTVQIKKSDLVKALMDVFPDGGYNQRGLVNNNLFLYRPGVSSTTDFNEILDPGMYQMSGFAPNNPSGGWGVLIVFRANTYIIQLSCNITNPASLHIRTKIVDGEYEFKEWEKFNFY